MSLNDNNDLYTQNFGAGSIAGNQAFSSPYLNFDPAYLNTTQPEFIFVGGGSKQRGRFELAFAQIGTTCMVGAGLGGAVGFFGGLRSTMLEGQTGKLRRTQLLNHVMKRGSTSARTLGTLAVIYSGFGVLASLIRGEEDDLNTVAAATATGLLYKSTSGLKKCGMGGAVGFGLSALYAIWNSRDKLSNLRQQLSPA